MFFAAPPLKIEPHI